MYTLLVSTLSNTLTVQHTEDTFGLHHVSPKAAIICVGDFYFQHLPREPLKKTNNFDSVNVELAQSSLEFVSDRWSNQPSINLGPQKITAQTRFEYELTNRHPRNDGDYYTHYTTALQPRVNTSPPEEKNLKPPR